MLSLGVETWSKSLHKVGFTRKAWVLLGLQGQTPGFRKTSLCAFQKPCGLSPLAQIKCSRTQTFRETSGTPSGDQTLLSHISNFISEPFRRSRDGFEGQPSSIFIDAVEEARLQEGALPRDDTLGMLRPPNPGCHHCLGPEGMWSAPHYRARPMWLAQKNSPLVPYVIFSKCFKNFWNFRGPCDAF